MSETLKRVLLDANKESPITKLEWLKDGKPPKGDPRKCNQMRYTLENGCVFVLPDDFRPQVKELNIYGVNP